MNRFGVLNLCVAIGLIASVTAIDCNTRPDFKNAKDCCPNSDFATSEILESCKDLKEEGQHSPGGPGGHKHHHNLCYGECIMNATALINFETMAVDEVKTKTYLSKVYSAGPDFIQVVSDAVTKCAAKGKEMHEMHKNDPKPTNPAEPCKPCAEMFLRCVHMETMINCPTSAWKNDETCNNVREYMMVCKPPKGGPPK